jgi:short-subunit dehydrogenase
VSSLFAAKRYNHVALIARRAEQLGQDQKAVQEASNAHVKVKTYVCDVSDIAALTNTLNAIEKDIGTPESIFFSAARVLGQKILEHPWEEIDLDWKVCRLVSLANQRKKTEEHELIM